jgi:hypothetical protein
MITSAGIPADMTQLAIAGAGGKKGPAKSPVQEPGTAVADAGDLPIRLTGA